MWRFLSQTAFPTTSAGISSLDISKGTMTKLQGFVGLIDSFALMAAEKNALEVARAVLQKSGISAELARDNTVEGKARQENIEELINGIADFE